MQPYMLICLCIWILALTTALEVPTAVTGVSAPRFAFGALLVAALSGFLLQGGALDGNAAALAWPAYWVLACNGENLRKRVYTLDMLAVCLPVLWAAAMFVAHGLQYMYFTFELSTDALNMEMTLWAAALLLRCAAYAIKAKIAE